MPGSIALLFYLDLAWGLVDNFLVQNFSHALFDKMIVKYAGHVLQDTLGTTSSRSGRFPLAGVAGKYADREHSKRGPLQNPGRSGRLKNLRRLLQGSHYFELNVKLHSHCTSSLSSKTSTTLNGTQESSAWNSFILKFLKCLMVIIRGGGRLHLSFRVA